MSTYINVTVGKAGLSDQAKRQTNANRQAKLEADARNKAEVDGTRQRDANRAQQGIGPDGKPLFGLPLQTAARKDEPAAFRVAINADYYVIEYGFTTGQDLDTRTFLRDPVTEQFLGPVGWCKDNTIPTSGDSYPIVWGGDNTGTGVEAVLFDRPAYKELYPSSKTAVLSLNGNWYNIKGDSVIISVEGFLGGEMVQNGYSWTNDTARRKWDKYAKHTSTSVYSNQAACIPGDFIIYLSIAIDTGKISYSASL
jgi:hypothetical protein